MIDLIKDVAEAVRATMSQQQRTSAYDTPATVKRIEGDVAWVHIPGGVDETPVKLTIAARPGDTVQIRVGGGSAWLTGNGTAPPTDDRAAEAADKKAVQAQETAKQAVDDAGRAKEAADSAEKSAESAQTSADNANQYASRALGGLSTVQSVVETLNWITEHGTMTLTTDTALDPTHVYFVVDPSGDYVVGSTHYSIVSEPDADDLSTYYVLSIDESLQNYVGTHLALTGEGLWLLPETGGYKVLIATGSGTTYTTAGTYIIDAVGNIVARFATEVQIGADGESHLFMDYHSLQFVDRNGDTFFYVSDLRDRDGNVTDYFTGDGTTTVFTLQISAINQSYTVTVDGVEQTTGITKDTLQFTFDTAPADGTVITAVYKPAWSDIARTMKAYTLGVGKPNTRLGRYSVREGYTTSAPGAYAHAEGSFTSAEGEASHSEGAITKAVEQYSHAQGLGTIAASIAQCVMGRYNVPDSQSLYALIIGNGRTDATRSNAYAVTFNGDEHLALNTSAGAGTIDGDLYAAITALGWGSEVIV